MTLRPCPECGQSVSSAASACPHCGFPLLKGAQSFSPKASRSRKAGLDFLEWTNLAVGGLYLLVLAIGLSNSRHASIVELPIVALPWLGLVILGAIFRSTRGILVTTLIGSALDLIIFVGLLGPYLFGTYAQSYDGSGVGLGLGICFLLQLKVLFVSLVVGAVLLVLARRRTASEPLT